MHRSGETFRRPLRIFGPMRLTDCGPGHAAEILTILNQAIVNTAALYDYRPRTLATVQGWLTDKQQNGRPMVGVEDEAGRLCGFGTFGPFRTLPAYKYTVEHSLYVADDYTRRGLGKLLLEELIRRAELKNVHAMIGVIDSQNAASIALHEQFGFARVGLLPQTAFKFGRWLDVVLYQLTLTTPADPIDG